MLNPQMYVKIAMRKFVSDIATKIRMPKIMMKLLACVY